MRLSKGTFYVLIDAMEQWTDQGIVLKVRPHGENGAVVSLLTENNGRHAGYVQGARSSKMRGMLEPGCIVSVDWSARVSGNLGNFKLEEDRNIAAQYMQSALKLSAIMAACSLCDSAIPEREGHAGLFHGMCALFDAFETEEWSAVYVMWEIALLKELGFGLNLTRCAGGGDPQDLTHVSPKSGHAVSREKAEPYKDRLLELPAFLRPVRGEASVEEIRKGLALTGYFLEHWVYTHHTKGVPEDRLRFEARFAKYSESNDCVTHTAQMDRPDGRQRAEQLEEIN